MGGVPLPPSRDAVLSALQQHAAGKPLELHRIIHAISRPSPDTLPDVLTALTHLTSHLHAQPETAAPLRQLIDAALSLDLSALLDPAPPATAQQQQQQRRVLATYTHFLSNLVSVDAAYVAPVLNLLASSFFAFPPALADLVAPSVGAVASLALATHPRSAALLADTVSRRFPHPVRPRAEHVCYFRAVFRTLRAVRNAHFSRVAITAAVERLSAIEALVPPAVVVVDAAAAPADADAAGADPADAGTALVAPAEKLQDVMMEVLRFIDAVAAKNANYETAVFRPLLAAYESHIVPVHRTRFTPFVLLHAASHLGATGVADVVEKFRTSFFDATVSARLREHYLEHSAALVMHARQLTAAHVQSWMFRLASWLNSYVDAVDRGALADAVDTDVHRLFYMACAVMMTVVPQRRDMLGEEALARMRLMRVLSSSLNPLSVVPRDVVEDFLSVVSSSAGVELRETMESVPESFAPTRTKYGAKNEFVYSVRCPELELTEVRRHIDNSLAEQDACTLERPRKRPRLGGQEGRATTAKLKLLAGNVDLEVSSY